MGKESKSNHADTGSSKEKASAKQEPGFFKRLFARVKAAFQAFAGFVKEGFSTVVEVSSKEGRAQRRVLKSQRKAEKKAEKETRKAEKREQRAENRQKRQESKKKYYDVEIGGLTSNGGVITARQTGQGVTNTTQEKANKDPEIKYIYTDITEPTAIKKHIEASIQEVYKSDEAKTIQGVKGSAIIILPHNQPNGRSDVTVNFFSDEKGENYKGTKMFVATWDKDGVQVKSKGDLDEVVKKFPDGISVPSALWVEKEGAREEKAVQDIDDHIPFEPSMPLPDMAEADLQQEAQWEEEYDLEKSREERYASISQNFLGYTMYIDGHADMPPSFEEIYSWVHHEPAPFTQIEGGQRVIVEFEDTALVFEPQEFYTKDKILLPECNVYMYDSKTDNLYILLATQPGAIIGEQDNQPMFAAGEVTGDYNQMIQYCYAHYQKECRTLNQKLEGYRREMESQAYQEYIDNPQPQPEIYYR